jgi:hypothetical protein
MSEVRLLFGTISGSAWLRIYRASRAIPVGVALTIGSSSKRFLVGANGIAVARSSERLRRRRSAATMRFIASGISSSDYS